MPQDITAFGLNPVLPAMATLHSIIVTQHSMMEMGQAVQLLEFVQSSIPYPSEDMQRLYIDLLVDLKMKVRPLRSLLVAVECLLGILFAPGHMLTKCHIPYRQYLHSTILGLDPCGRVSRVTI